MRSLRYLLLCGRKTLLGRGFACPSCGGHPGETLDRKYLVTAFRRCRGCGLLFRTPTSTALENEQFYQSDYQENTTTDLPDDERLAGLLRENFAGLSTSYLPYIEVLQALGAAAGQRVLDFGCSWGYGSHQLRQAGFTVEGFEISKPRADFARDKLGVATLSMNDIGTNAFDVFFSAHVIEHVPSVSEMLSLGERALRPGGLFVAFTPNGSSAYRAGNPRGWHRQWGGVHPQLLDDQFLRQARGGRSVLAATAPFPLDALKQWDGRGTQHAMDGWELMFAFRKGVV